MVVDGEMSMATSDFVTSGRPSFPTGSRECGNPVDIHAHGLALASALRTIYAAFGWVLFTGAMAKPKM
jgi:hypothetical protein